MECRCASGSQQEFSNKGTLVGRNGTKDTVGLIVRQTAKATFWDSCTVKQFQVIMFKAILLLSAGLLAAAQDEPCKPWVEGEVLPANCQSTSTRTVINTVIIPEYTTVGQVTSTMMNTVNIPTTLLPSTEIVRVTSGSGVVTVTGSASGVGSTVTVTVSGSVPTTVSQGTVTSWVTISGSASTMFVTQSGTATVTSTTMAGYTTVSSCLPTTTVVSTVTTSVPTATAPAGGVVTYSKQNCGVVVCQSGYQVATVSSVPRSCVLVYYGQTLASSTCIPDYCCVPVYGSRPVVRQTTCSAAGVVCPANTVALSNSAGASVPCVETYSNNVIVSSTCQASSCCSQPKSQWTTTVTAAATATATATSKTVSCKTAVKCSIYNKDSKTNYIVRCKSDDCSTSLCCKEI